MPLDATPARQGGAPAGLRADDPDLARLRCLLAALRPEAVDPMEPPAATLPTCHAPAPRDPTASWGGIPRGFGAPTPQPHDAAGAAEVLAQVGELPAPSPTVLRWLRERGDGHPRGPDGRRLHGEAVTDAALRAVVRRACVDLACALADPAGPWHGGLALPDDLGARREAAYLLGRRLLWGAASAWGK